MAPMDHSREVREAAALLRNPEVQRSSEKYLEVIKRVISFMTQGIDVSSLFSDFVKATNTTNLVQKKLVYLFLCHYADTNADLAMMVVNTLQKDCRDENPMVRGLALRSLTSLRITSLVEYVLPLTMRSLGDQNAYVRRTAILGVLKMFYLDRERVLEGDTVDRLYSMLRDRDVAVVVNAVDALEEILADRGGMALNKAIAHHLLSRLREFNDWGQCTVLQLLSRYTPADEDEVYTLLNYLDDRMKQVNAGVVMAAVKLFIHLTKDLPHLHNDIYDAIRGALLTLLAASSHEMAYVILQHLQLIMTMHPHLLEADYRHFFIDYHDPVVLKKQKISLLVDLTTARNCGPVLDELSEYATDSNASVGRMAIRSIGLIAMRVEHSAEYALDKLLALADLGIDTVSAEVLVAMKDILHKYPSKAPEIVSRIEGSLNLVDDVEAKVALLWILGEYGELVEDAPYILEPLIDDLESEKSAAVHLALLTSSARLFFKRPAEMQYMFGKLLKWEISNDAAQPEPHDRALFYYRLLTAPGVGGVDVASSVINYPHPLRDHIGSELNEQLRNTLLYRDFDSLAVTYGRPSELFITQQPPYARVARAGGDDEIDGGELLGGGSAPQRLVLASSVPMDKQLFNALWKGAVEVAQFSVQLSAVAPDKAAIEALFASLNIFTMASGAAPGALKFLFYAQQARGPVVLLTELKVPDGTQTGLLTVKGALRPEDAAAKAAVAPVVREFVERLQNSL